MVDFFFRLGAVELSFVLFVLIILFHKVDDTDNNNHRK
jgi:hypothetical protein